MASIHVFIDFIFLQQTVKTVYSTMPGITTVYRMHNKCSIIKRKKRNNLQTTTKMLCLRSLYFYRSQSGLECTPHFKFTIDISITTLTNSQKISHGGDLKMYSGNCCMIGRLSTPITVCHTVWNALALPRVKNYPLKMYVQRLTLFQRGVHQKMIKKTNNNKKKTDQPI